MERSAENKHELNKYRILVSLIVFNDNIVSITSPRTNANMLTGRSIISLSMASGYCVQTSLMRGVQSSSSKGQGKSPKERVLCVGPEQQSERSAE